MSRRTRPWSPGLPCWTDLAAPDPEAARAFYAAVIGWDFRVFGPEFGGYSYALADGEVAAGLGPATGPAHGGWSVYLATDDAEATARAAVAAGGSVVTGPMEVSESGSMLVVADPSGAVTGAWQHGGLIGASIVNETGGLVWEDLRSTDPSASRAFLSAVFGLAHDGFEGSPDDYTTMRLADEEFPCGGVGPLFGAPAAGWVPYFMVDDVDAAAAAATASGGSVVDGPQDSPFGRMATIADPDGAQFTVMRSPEGAPQPDRS